ncbi:hypothetical protein [Pseudomonas sp. ICMP 561]|uniref:hypothetical protein n=1 Tax=Pseudomonas sp. ICMP 561 TaxID=1718918 RepID=UPI000C079F74|nr:hypothetical protein [Pseudomonas sp. ICMP 561]PHN32694.1 hypothetical protein AO242_08510 [Pseudomonas sp. ICMP 561]
MVEEDWLAACRDWCRRAKYLSDEIEWQAKPTHSGWLQATSMLLDERRVSIPHLYFKGEYQPGHIGERMSYGLMFRNGKEKRRVFMLEIFPTHERSHKEHGKVFFGPHIHLGDERLCQVTRTVISQLRSATMSRWVERFRRHARVLDNKDRTLSPPFKDDLFGSDDG